MPGWLKRLLPAAPHLHFMSVAPLDVWARMLFLPPVWVPVRYWARLALNLVVSALMTAVTLPERVLLWPVLALVGWLRRDRLERGPGAVVVLGYYRSGTTHLQNLLACDRRLVTPRWAQTLVPHVGPIGWSAFRVFLVACLGTRRPQDDMAFGPEWPGEDDFALNNWVLASSLPGRFVVPGRHGHYSRFHSLEGLSARERRRWRHAQWAFLWKLTWLARGRRLMLKSPSHTARVRVLLEMFGSSPERPGRVKFVHVSRAPGAVVRSNVSMGLRMAAYGVQESPSEAEIERRVVEEYGATERKFLDEARAIPAGDLAMMRYEDLVADPVGELRRVYSELGLGWDAEVESRVVWYLDSVREYKVASVKRGLAERPPPAALEWIVPAFGHDRPARATVAPGAVGVSDEDLRRRRRRAYPIAVVTSVLAGAAWLGVAMAAGNRIDWGVWLVGGAVGYAAIRTAGVGTVRLGVWSAAWMLLVWVGVAFAATRLIYYKTNVGPTAWEMWDATRKELTSLSTLVWVVLGVLSAFRFASRRHGAVPGG